MKSIDWHTRYIKSIFIIALLVALAWTVTGCEELGFPPPNPPAEKPEENVAPPTTISTADRAVLVVYEHLLNQAESYKAKMYLAEFYTVCDNWSAETERFKDGSSIWYVLVDMTDNETWQQRLYWQQASWFVQDDKVMPSNHHQANALRIEADLQELSPPPEPQTTDD